MQIVPVLLSLKNLSAPKTCGCQTWQRRVAGIRTDAGGGVRRGGAMRNKGAGWLIWVLHARQMSFFSRLRHPNIIHVNSYCETAWRFSTAKAAAGFIAAHAELAEMAARGEAGVCNAGDLGDR
jgi:hypothetical protein